MRVRAVAAPSNQSNAIGTLELECAPQGLRLLHLGIAGYREGYAPAALASGSELLVPWPQVEEVRAGDNHVFLVLAQSTTPHSRLCLTHFSQGTDLPEPERRRRKLIIGIATLALTVSVTLAIASQWATWTANSSRWTALGIALLAAFAVLLLGVVVGIRVVGRGPDSEQLQQQFIAELKLFRPKPVSVAPPAAPPREDPVELADLIRVVPRSTLAVIIVLTASSLAAILTTTWLLRGPDDDRERHSSSHGRSARNLNLQDDEDLQSDGDEEPEGPARRATRDENTSAARPEPRGAAAAISPSGSVSPGTAGSVASLATPTPADSSAVGANAAGAAAAPAVVVAGEPCRCERPSSALWALDFPRLSTLLIAQQSSTHKEHQHLEIELAVINNGKKTLDEVNLSVQFYEDEGKSATRLRPLHYPGALEPGQAIKWHVEARGTSFVVNNPVRDVLPPDPTEMATPDAFAELLKANHRPVRLHAAMMLAFLGDPRAKMGALKLRDALSEPEMPYLDRVLATQGNLITCDWRTSAPARIRDVSACVFNISGKPVEHPGIKVRALDRVFDYRNPVAAPPLVIAEKVAPLTGILPPAQGVRAVVSLDTDNPDGKPAVAFEALADTAELL